MAAPKKNKAVKNKPAKKSSPPIKEKLVTVNPSGREKKLYELVLDW